MLLISLFLLVSPALSFFPHPAFTYPAPSQSLHSTPTSDPFQKRLTDDDYIAIGLACCFRMSDEGKLGEAWIFEPLTAGTLETIEQGIETSYKQVMALSAGDFFEGEPESATGIKMANIEALVRGGGVRGEEECAERNHLPCCFTTERALQNELYRARFTELTAQPALFSPRFSARAAQSALLSPPC